MQVFSTFWLANVLRATAACIFGHRNFKKWPASVVFSTFWLTNMLRATAACHFWTSELPKWLRQCGVLCILTCKCASRHSGVPFLNIGTSKMAPNVVFCAFWLANVLRATAACHFSTSELQKWLRECGVLCILTCKCASRHSGVPFFTCLLNSYLRTRRFSEATFRTSGTTNHWKNTAIRDVPNIFRACTFFLVTLHAGWSSFCWLDISTLLDTSTLLFNSAYCRKLDF